MVSTHRGAKKRVERGERRWEQGVKWSTAPRASADMQNLADLGQRENWLQVKTDKILIPAFTEFDIDSFSSPLNHRPSDQQRKHDQNGLGLFR